MHSGGKGVIARLAYVHVIVGVRFASTQSGGDGCTRRCTQLVRRGAFFHSRAVES